ncbi:hypothetical protein L596_013283 [Steinernema carpocapsae]|uniref:TGF-beta propeptide domain-containing protein n=1 Tax=Steinernema carpocapsae TaxID=34508 RepID=A0A4U5NZP4_STECR|nr:hypothetical protein L596_013283 [Steinernema carpocapsae]
MSLIASSLSFKRFSLIALICLFLLPSTSARPSLMDFYSQLVVKSHDSQFLRDSPIPLTQEETQQLSTLFMKRRHLASRTDPEQPETDPKKRKVDRHSARILNSIHSRFHF